jgi:heat shock protein HtpX
VYFLGAGGEAWRIGGTKLHTPAGDGAVVAFDLVPAVTRAETLQFSRSHGALVAELHLPTDRPGLLLRCKLEASPQDLARLQRQIHRSGNHQRSTYVIAGMVLLLAVCGFVVGGDEGTRWAVMGGAPPAAGDPGNSHEIVQRWFGARLLRPAEMPELFNILADICRRANLPRMPELFYIAAPDTMNAYAIGDSNSSAITLTEGLLRGMSFDEIAGILAHEVAHIRNNDGWAMAWAAALHRAITLTSLIGLAFASSRRYGAAASGSIAVLASAATISKLLCLALSRIRELDADATALELTDNTPALIAALNKLERHHTGVAVWPMAAFEDGVMRFLRSHPPTAERVGTLLALTY